MLTLSLLISVPSTQTLSPAGYALQWSTQQHCAAENVWEDHVPQLPKCLPKSQGENLEYYCPQGIFHPHLLHLFQPGAVLPV